MSNFVGCHAYILNTRGMEALIQCNTPVRTHVDHALSAASDQFTIYGVNAQEDRFRQTGKGSDVQQLVVRKNQ